MKIKSKRPDGSVRITTENSKPTKTQQHHQAAHDINNIMKKYQKIGVGYNALPPSSKGVYGDFTKFKNYQESVQAAIDADNSFNTLPSSVRKRFDNNPQQLFDFLNDKSNREEAISLGLIDKPTETPTIPTPTT